MAATSAGLGLLAKGGAGLPRSGSPIYPTQLHACDVREKERVILTEGLDLVARLAAASALARLGKSMYSSFTLTTETSRTKANEQLQNCKTLAQEFEAFQKKLETFEKNLNETVASVQNVKPNEMYTPQGEEEARSLYDDCQQRLPTLQSYQRLLESLKATFTLEKRDKYGFDKSLKELEEAIPKDPQKNVKKTPSIPIPETTLFNDLEQDLETHLTAAIALLQHVARATLTMEVYQRIVANPARLDAEKNAAQITLNQADAFDFNLNKVSDTPQTYTDPKDSLTQNSYLECKGQYPSLNERVTGFIDYLSKFTVASAERHLLAQEVLPWLKDLRTKLEATHHRLEIAMAGSAVNVYGIERALVSVHDRNFKASETALRNTLTPPPTWSATFTSVVSGFWEGLGAASTPPVDAMTALTLTDKIPSPSSPWFVYKTFLLQAIDAFGTEGFKKALFENPNPPETTVKTFRNAFTSILQRKDEAAFKVLIPAFKSWLEKPPSLKTAPSTEVAEALRIITIPVLRQQLQWLSSSIKKEESRIAQFKATLGDAAKRQDFFAAWQTLHTLLGKENTPTATDQDNEKLLGAFTDYFKDAQPVTRVSQEDVPKALEATLVLTTLTSVS